MSNFEIENKVQVNELIASRWSPRAFDSRPVEDEKLEAILEAARWAPSAMNEQPWRFIYATKDNPEAYEKLLNCLVEANQVWAKEAPVLLLTVAKTHYSNFDSRNGHAWHDVGMATANMAIQATELGIFLHMMGGFSADTARTTLNIPEGFEAVTMVALGYKGEPGQLPEPLKEREEAPRNRKPMQELIHKGEWQTK